MAQAAEDLFVEEKLPPALRVVDSGKPKCPLTTSQLCDIVISFVELYNEPAGIDLHSYQRVFMRRIVESVFDQEGNVLTGLWARQGGKSESLSSLASALCIIIPALACQFPGDDRLSQFTEGFWIGIFAPKQQQSGIIYERIRKRAEKDSSIEIYNDPDLNIRITQSRGDQVSWSNGSYVIAQTASEQSNVEGKTFHLVIIDEAQLVSKSKITKEIGPMLAATNGVLCLIGTANALYGNFRDTIKRNLLNEAQPNGKRDHFEFPYDIIIRERRKTYERTGNKKHLLYERWVAGELRRLGGNIENEEFRQNFRLQWQETNLGAIDLTAFEEAGIGDMEMVESKFNGHIVASVDFARKRDATVLTIVEVLKDIPIIDQNALIRPGDDQPVFYQKVVLAWYEIPGRKWRDILQEIVGILSNYAVKVLVCDATGVGDPLTENLAELLPSVQVEPYTLSHVGNDRMYKLYIQELEAGRWLYPAGPETARTPVFQQNDHEHRQLIKDRVGVYTKYFAPPGEHDDFPDSAALAAVASTIEVRGVREIECVPNPFYSRTSSQRGSSRAERYR